MITQIQTVMKHGMISKLTIFKVVNQNYLGNQKSKNKEIIFTSITYNLGIKI